MPKIGGVFREQLIFAAQGTEIDLDVVANTDAAAAIDIVERPLVAREFDRDGDAVALGKIGAVEAIIVAGGILKGFIGYKMHELNDAAVGIDRFISADGIIGDFFKKGAVKLGKRKFLVR